MAEPLFPLAGLQVTIVPAAAVQERYDIGSAAIYVGTAALGQAPDAGGWTIARITLVAGNPTVKAWTGVGAAIWDNRATETYT